MNNLIRHEDKLCSLKIKTVLQINDKISVKLIAVLGFKWNCLWYYIIC